MQAGVRTLQAQARPRTSKWAQQQDRQELVDVIGAVAMQQQQQL